MKTRILIHHDLLDSKFASKSIEQVVDQMNTSLFTMKLILDHLMAPLVLRYATIQPLKHSTR